MQFPVIDDPDLLYQSHHALPDVCHARVAPEAASRPELLLLNRPLCRQLGLDPDARDDGFWAEVFSGNRLLPGMQPRAMAYAGHQFGHFSPQLGDGRAHYLGELLDPSGRLVAVQLKGSGRTPFSRQGDGRAALGPVLREYLVSEAMHALGVPTTRALAAVRTGDWVFREAALPGAVLTRVADGLLRVGTFQYFAARGDQATVQALVRQALARHGPEPVTGETPALTLLRIVARRQADLLARWMGLGFIHGVMNTDNVAISGETIDYGPCAFMDRHALATVYSAIDRQGRYAYGQQPAIAQWNLARLAEALLPAIDPDNARALALATECVEGFGSLYREAYRQEVGAKLGLEQPVAADDSLIADWFGLLEAERVDHTLAFRFLGELVDLPEAGWADGRFAGLFEHPEAALPWLTRWRQRLHDQAGVSVAAAMAARNPLYIPRNHRVEQALEAAIADGDLGRFQRLQAVLTEPYREQAGCEDLTRPPEPAEEIRRTFCGT